VEFGLTAIRRQTFGVLFCSETEVQKGILMSMPRRAGAIVCALWAACTIANTAQGQSQADIQRVLIQSPKPYTKLVSDINALGGMVRHEYKNIDAVAADIPTASLKALYAVAPASAISKDDVVPGPRASSPSHKMASPAGNSQVQSLQYKSSSKGSKIPDAAYALNLAGVNLKELHKRYRGEGVIVAVIDSGIRTFNGESYPAVAGSWDPSRCENFVDDDRDGILDGKCVDDKNDPHGTFVAAVIAGHTELDLTGTGNFLTSIQRYAPSALKDKTILPLYGSAPAAQIYAFRVFAPGHGAPRSRILAAIDRVIELRKSGVPILVCNLSLSTATLFAGRDTLQRAVDALLENDIVPVVSTGNAGPSSLTIGSPASSFSAIAVGASSPAANERIFWDNCDPNISGPCFAGAGATNRPFDGTQTAWFSSHGPTADGRSEPGVVASGFANFSQGFGRPDQVDIAAGTSFSAPIVSGIAGVLRQAHPGNTATQIRNAILASANAGAIEDGSTEWDRGRGLVNAAGADNLLSSGRVPDRLPRPNHPTKSVAENIQDGVDEGDLQVVEGNVRQSIRNLKPGQRGEILYRVTEDMNQVVITISHITPSANQNKTWGDDLFVNVHSAKTSSIGPYGDYLFSNFLSTETTVVLNNPETGILRVTLSGDWFNAGTISADVNISSTVEPLPKITAQRKIDNGDLLVFPFTMPPNVKHAEFNIEWVDDWARYPTSDLDLMVGSPKVTPGFVDFVSATLNEPEVVSVTNPAPGTWYIYPFAFEVDAAKGDKVTIRVILDGTVVDLKGKPVEESRAEDRDP
jgi:subtilisin family serine protease